MKSPVTFPWTKIPSRYNGPCVLSYLLLVVTTYCRCISFEANGAVARQAMLLRTRLASMNAAARCWSRTRLASMNATARRWSRTRRVSCSPARTLHRSSRRNTDQAGWRNGTGTGRNARDGGRHQGWSDRRRNRESIDCRRDLRGRPRLRGPRKWAALTMDLVDTGMLRSMENRVVSPSECVVGVVGAKENCFSARGLGFVVVGVGTKEEGIGRLVVVVAVAVVATGVGGVVCRTG